MLSLNRGRAHTARINGADITVGPRETLLQAALRQGVEFPNSCRVGGCGACKCRLVSGRVDELTETGYLLSAEELADGTVLACQSRLKSDIEVDVELDDASQAVAGRVIGQTRLTHDITRLTVQLDAPFDYAAGQFARVSMDGLDGVTRSYSFARPARADGIVEFFIRHVPGGRFSGMVHAEDVMGRAVQVEGPAGDFWLRDGDAPLVLVAGGSGLAPILALLKAAVEAGVSRPATLLFGARERRDLYAIDAIEAIADAWQGPFEFVPVLSHAADDVAWTGARGLVTEHIAAHLAPGAHAYLCGPPAMVDAAVEVLEGQGVGRGDIHFDRFTTQADVSLGSFMGARTAQGVDALPEPLPDADASGASPLTHALHYLKFFLFHGIGLAAAAVLLLGGSWLSWGLLALVGFYVIGDAIGGDDTSTPELKHTGVLTAQLWLALPLMSLIAFIAVWGVSSADIFGFGAAITELTGYDVLAARAATDTFQHVCALLITGLIVGMVATIPGHELTHRTWDPISLVIGRWLLSFSFDAVFSVEHVYGHHRYVSTTEDPATAPRGRSVYAHIVISTVEGNLSAWQIEAQRLAKRRLPVLSWHNVVIRGWLMSAALVAVAYAIGGGVGALFFTGFALIGKALLEIVNYMEHYGMVRDPATPVQPRHSWNTNRRISSWAMFNLTRHSHHHAQGEVPYQDLRPYPDAPMMVSGYLTTVLLTLIPPVWHRLMIPKLHDWDRRFASEAELKLVEEANRASGIPALMNGPRRPAAREVTQRAAA